MNLSIENILLGASILLLISILLSRSLDKFGIPALVLFLGVGMLAGSEGIGNIHFNDPGLAQSLGIVALTSSFFLVDWIYAGTQPNPFSGGGLAYQL